MVLHNLCTKPKAIIFDWDATLADSLPIVHHAVTHAFKEFDGPKWTLEDTKINIHQSYREYLPTLFPENWEQVIEVYRKKYMELNHSLQLLPMAKEVLDALDATDLHVCLVSNKKGKVLRQELEQLKVREYFDVIIGSGDLEYDKPHPITVQEALKLTNICPTKDSVWFVGDSTTDMKTAYNTGCVAILYGDDDHTCERYIECRPNLHVPDHASFLKHIKQVIK